MKIKKEELETLTEAAVGVSEVAMALLLATECPVPVVYEAVEQVCVLADKVRTSLELPSIAKEVMTSGKISKRVAKALAEAKEKKTERKAIGFEAPKSEEVEVETEGTKDEPMVRVNARPETDKRKMN